MKLAILRGLMFMVLGLPVALAQAIPFSQEGPSCPLPGVEMVKPHACMATVFVCNAFGWINECSQRQEERCQTYCVR